MRVPNVRLTVDTIEEEEQPLLVHGKVYDGVIERIDEPTPMKSMAYMYRVMFILNVEGQKVYTNYPGLLHTALLIYRNRQLWIGKTVKVRIRVVQYHQENYYDATINWEDSQS